MCIGVPQFHNLNEVAENAARICKATHADPLCVASSVMIAVLIALMLQGRHDLMEDCQLEAMISTAVDVADGYLTDEAHRQELLRHTDCSDFNIEDYQENPQPRRKKTEEDVPDDKEERKQETEEKPGTVIYSPDDPEETRGTEENKDGYQTSTAKGLHW
ncbi:hypothetical protein LSAT2_023116 [Lamellibrachia satsuma]|nr:hypothetical protein LSAT2_023116 [Lamellibrachia satsuma]